MADRCDAESLNTLGERSDFPRIFEFSGLPKPKLLVPDLLPLDPLPS